MSIHSSNSGSSLPIQQSFELVGSTTDRPNISLRCCSSKTYQAEINPIRDDVPDIRLWRDDSTRSVAGVSYFRKTASPQVGIGSDESTMRWLKMKRSGFAWKIVQEFEWEGDIYKIGRTFSAEDGVESVGQKMLLNLKVRSKNTGQIVALLNSEHEQGQLGKLNFTAETSPELELLIILGVLSWFEISRRTKKNWQ